MMSPDAIADHALLTVSRWQRQTSQQRADRILNEWQANRHLPPELRLAASPHSASNDNDSSTLVDEYERDLDVLREVLGS